MKKILFVFFAVIFLSAGCNSSSQSANVQVPPVNQNSGQQAAATATDTESQSAPGSVDWQTYENKTLGFKFEYPKTWTINDLSSAPFVAVAASSCQLNSQTLKTCKPAIFGIEVKAYTGGNGLPPNLANSPTKTIQVAGITADEVISSNINHTDIGFAKGGNYYHIAMDVSDNPKEQIDPILNNMLSSFAFVTPAPATANTPLPLPPVTTSDRDRTRVHDIRSILPLLELYFSANNSYPAALKDLSPKYANSLPTAPEPADGSCSEIQNTYTYTQTNSGADYTLTFCLGNTNSALAPGMHTASLEGIK